jgi:small subunit ribosomal protein S16
MYRISAMDIRRPRNGRVLEEVGWYSPQEKNPEKQVSFDRERVEFWLKSGAQPSATVRHLLEKHGVTVKAE